MTERFDPTLKALVELAPADWLALLGRPTTGGARVINADIGTVVSGSTDSVIQVDGSPPYLLHLEFQSGHDGAEVPSRVLVYNALLVRRHSRPVVSVAVILRPEADSPRLTGRLDSALPGEEPELALRYRVFRVWQIPAEQFLAGGLGTLPLAPVSAVGLADLPGVIARMHERLDAPAASDRAQGLWTSTFVLMRSRYPEEFTKILLREATHMKESVTYQAIIREGRVEQAHRTLLRLGTLRYGLPDRATAEALQSISNVEDLEALTDRLLIASSWRELLATSAPQARPHGDGHETSQP